MTQTTCTGSSLIKRFGRVQLNWSNFNVSDFGKMQWPILQMLFFSVRSQCFTEAMHWHHPSHIAETELLESVPAIFSQLSWNFRQSLSGCRALAGNRQYITGLSIYYRDMIWFDGLYLKKSRSACSILGQNIDISFGPNGEPHGARWWTFLRSY